VAHVLLVDDDADIIEIYRTVLEAKGHTVSAAFSGSKDGTPWRSPGPTFWSST